MTENGEELDESIMQDYRLIAKLKAKLGSQIELSSRYKTLFYGLKRNHPRNVALVHPFAFLLRRIIFVTSLLYFFQQPVFSVLLFMSLTLSMLVYSVHEKQWETPAINRQNIANEAILYAIGALLFLCRGNLASV